MYLRKFHLTNPMDPNFESRFQVSDNKNEFIREIVEAGMESDLLDMLPNFSLGNQRTISLILEENNFKKREVIKKSGVIIMYMNPEQLRLHKRKQLEKAGLIKPKEVLQKVQMNPLRKKSKHRTGLWDTSKSKELIGQINQKINYGKLSTAS